METGCALGGRLEGGAGREWWNEANGGASNDCDSPSVVGGAVACPGRPTTPDGEKELRAEYGLTPGAHCDGAAPAPYGDAWGQYAGGRSDETPVDGAKVCDTVAVSPD